MVPLVADQVLLKLLTVAIPPKVSVVAFVPVCAKINAPVPILDVVSVPPSIRVPPVKLLPLPDILRVPTPLLIMVPEPIAEPKIPNEVLTGISIRVLAIILTLPFQIVLNEFATSSGEIVV